MNVASRLLPALCRNPSVKKQLMMPFSTSLFPENSEGMDKIEIKDACIFGYHGVLPEEKRLGQRFVMDITMFCDLSKAGQTDNLNDTVDYSQVYRQVEKLVKGMPVNLIEHLGQRIADELISTHRLIKGVEIQIRKPHVAIPGMQASSVGVTLRRFRRDLR